MQRLAGARELLDGDLTDVDALVGNLRDLRRINRRLGGLGLSRRAVEALIAVSVPGGHSRRRRSTPITLLDVGTGGADIPEALLEDPRLPLEITAIDSRAEVLDAAIRARPGLSTRPGMTLLVADGTALPFDDRSFDIVHSSLLLHHLEPDQARAALREMARVARIGIVANDLSRGWLSWLGGWLLIRLATRNRFTRSDGPMSVRRSYLVGEARHLVEEAGLRVVHQERGWFGHRWAIGAVPR